MKIQTLGYVTDLLELIASSYKSHNVKLMEVIETDELYIKAGLKGRPLLIPK